MGLKEFCCFYGVFVIVVVFLLCAYVYIDNSDSHIRILDPQCIFNWCQYLNKIIHLLFYECVPACMHVHYTCASYMWRPEEGAELELSVVVNCHVFTETQTQGLCKSNRCNQPLSQLFSLALPLLNSKYSFRLPVAIKGKCIWGGCLPPILQQL